MRGLARWYLFLRIFLKAKFRLRSGVRLSRSAASGPKISLIDFMRSNRTIHRSACLQAAITPGWRTPAWAETTRPPRMPPSPRTKRTPPPPPRRRCPTWGRRLRRRRGSPAPCPWRERRLLFWRENTVLKKSLVSTGCAKLSPHYKVKYGREIGFV